MYKYFICTINIVPVYDVSFGRVLVLDRQVSYRAQISFGTSIFFTVHLRVSVTSRLYSAADTMFLLAAEIFLSLKSEAKLFSWCSEKSFLLLAASPTLFF